MGSTGSNGPISEPGKKPSSSKYKGVVPQPNGRWGAQIYDKHHRVWLGTFDQEEQAAMAYDVAARRFRGQDAATNLPVDPSAAEALFLTSHPKAEIVDMLRKHTYSEELQESSIRYQHSKCACMSHAASREVLFEKALTPSDVGKLNRMVIPKHHAERHFPQPPETGTLLIFEDNAGKAWRFRYCYWSSSQSYVLTKGWSYFVKDKKLTTGDVVTFGRSTGPETKLFVDRKSQNQSEIMEHDDGVVDPMGEVRLFGVNINYGTGLNFDGSSN